MLCVDRPNPAEDRPTSSDDGRSSGGGPGSVHFPDIASSRRTRALAPDRPEDSPIRETGVRASAASFPPALHGTIAPLQPSWISSGTNEHEPATAGAPRARRRAALRLDGRIHARANTSPQPLASPPTLPVAGPRTAHPVPLATRRGIHEEGNADQCDPAGREPDCHC